MPNKFLAVTRLKFFPLATVIILSICPVIAQGGLKRCDLSIDAQTLTQVPIALTQAEMEIGMSGNQGYGAMIFEWSSAEKRVFWMRKMQDPLLAVFINENGFVIQIIYMQPNSEQLHWSAEPVALALELTPKAFAQAKLNIGSKVKKTNCDT